MSAGAGSINKYRNPLEAAKIMLKLNKEDFLNSELGSNLLECIESWDWALRGGVKTKPLADWCQAQWEVYQIMFRQIFHINYHFTRTDERFGICTENEKDWLIKEVKK